VTPLPIGKDDGDLPYTVALVLALKNHFYQKGVTVRKNSVKVSIQQHFPVITTKAGGAIVRPQAQHRPGKRIRPPT
jgi:hypothetical protein